MAGWDGDFDVTVDDRSLLRAIQITEGTVEGHPDWNHGQWNRMLNSSITTTVISTPAFNIVKDNEHLRTLLRVFLELNIAVKQASNALAIEERQGILRSLFTRSKKANLKAQLESLEVLRDEAFKKYEMLRKLTDIDNRLLMRRCS